MKFTEREIGGERGKSTVVNFIQIECNYFIGGDKWCLDYELNCNMTLSNYNISLLIIIILYRHIRNNNNNSYNKLTRIKHLRLS